MENLQINTGHIFGEKLIARIKVANITFNIVEGTKIPNRFQRWMQKICFGIEWEIVKD